jgi:polar amino acid transport system substrate-binding protein
MVWGSSFGVMWASMTLAAVVCYGESSAWGAGASLRICDDGAEWPPYVYAERVNQRKTDRLRGYSVEVIREIARRAQWQFTLDLLPWSRCLALVKAGRYHMVLNASPNPERQRDYLLTRPYYATHHAYFYSRLHYANGLVLNRPEDAKRYKVCGMQGYNYRDYGFAEGELDQGSLRFPEMIAKLHAGRCDLFFEKREIMQGFGLVDGEMAALLNDGRLGRGDLNSLPPTRFSMLVSRAVPGATTLRTQLDRMLTALEQEGLLTKWEMSEVGAR